MFQAGAQVRDAGDVIVIALLVFPPASVTEGAENALLSLCSARAVIHPQQGENILFTFIFSMI